jgi:hypothetical protein
MSWTVHLARYGEIINAYQILACKPEGKRAPGCRWESNIEIGLKRIGNESLYWICLTEVETRDGLFVNTVMNLLVL